MAITFHGLQAVPTDNGVNSDAGGTITIDKDVTPISSMQAGDLIIVLINQRVTGQTFSNSVNGGQTWSFFTQHSSGSQSQRIAWAQFNGTWTADPVFSTTSTGGNALTAIALVYRPTNTGAVWSVDNAQQTANTTPTTPFDVTISGQTPTASASVVTTAYWFNTSAAGMTFALQTAGWNNPGSIAQFRNTQGSDTSVSVAYKIQTSAAATGSVANRQLTSTGTTTYHGIFTFKETLSSPPAFSVSPTVTSETSNAYTLGYTPDSASTFYVAAVPAGAATPSAAQIKAGTGGGIVASANEAVSGADTTVISLASVSPLFPKYKLCALLSSGSGDSSIVALDNQFLDPPAGKQFKVFDVPLSATAVESLVSVSPAIVDGDIWVVDSVTTPGGYATVLTVDGDFDVDVDGDTARQEVVHDVYDNSLAAYYGSASIYIGNHAPTVVSDPAELAVYEFAVDTPIDPPDLTTLVEDDEFDPITVTALTSLPGTLAVSNGDLVGQSADEGVFHTTLQFEDIAGDSVSGSITMLIGDIPVPDVTGASEGAGLSTIASSYLVGQVVNRVTDSSEAGTILAQTPEFGESVAPHSTVSLTVSAGSGSVSVSRTSVRLHSQSQRRRRRL